MRTKKQIREELHKQASAFNMMQTQFFSFIWNESPIPREFENNMIDCIKMICGTMFEMKNHEDKTVLVLEKEQVNELVDELYLGLDAFHYEPLGRFDAVGRLLKQLLDTNEYQERHKEIDTPEFSEQQQGFEKDRKRERG